MDRIGLPPYTMSDLLDAVFDWKTVLERSLKTSVAARSGRIESQIYRGLYFAEKILANSDKVQEIIKDGFLDEDPSLPRLTYHLIGSPGHTAFLDLPDPSIVSVALNYLVQTKMYGQPTTHLYY
jgi:hypothetical protein